MPKIIVTGAPGSGKTTLLEAIAARGFTVMPEVARLVIQQESRVNSEVLPWKNRELFQNRVAELQYDLEQEQDDKSIIFYDRSLIDGIAYFKLGNIAVPENLNTKCRATAYAKVFLTERLPNYTNDAQRFENETEALKIEELLVHTYCKDFGIRLERIPSLQIEERVEFVLSRI